jgi:hypothetical protein
MHRVTLGDVGGFRAASTLLSPTLSASVTAEGPVGRSLGGAAMACPFPHTAVYQLRPVQSSAAVRREVSQADD